MILHQRDFKGKDIFQQLDIYLKQYKDKESIVIVHTAGEPQYINADEQLRIINKLKRDGYIIKSNDDNSWSYEITVEGMIFEGYVEQNKQKAAAIRRQKDFDNRLSYGTVFLAIGTFLLFAVELYRTYLEHFSCHCH